MSVEIYSDVVSVFSYDLEDVFDLGGRHRSITLIGPPAATTGGLSAGDTVLVPTRNGAQRRCDCVEFPLVNLGPERVEWIRVTVTGVSADDVQIGTERLALHRNCTLNRR